jgi:hypothetical protein
MHAMGCIAFFVVPPRLGKVEPPSKVGADESDWYQPSDAVVVDLQNTRISNQSAIGGFNDERTGNVPGT